MNSNNRLLPQKDRITIEEENLKRVTKWIQASDAKIGTILAFQAGLIAFLATKGNEIGQILTLNQINNTSAPLVLALLVFLLSSLYSLKEAFSGLFPDTKTRTISLIFFGSIPAFGVDKFKRNFQNLSYNDYEDELLSQIYVNSSIASKKFNHVKNSIKGLFVAGIAWLVILILVPILL
ncbi:MAG: DUF5706 domain-containing protein [Candidatus Daviesbacteria bacterium]|nr:DUF5706 domain-containing protein [Candidatus Daviesbacteria bacterium]